MKESIQQILSPHDIHGRVDTELQCPKAISIARAFGDLISPEGDREFLIGHDIRYSSASLAEAVSIGLRSGGHHVTHIGITTTPMLRWFAAEQGFDGAVMITGDQLPKEYNGLKLYREQAIALGMGHGLDKVIDQAAPPFASGHNCTSELHYASPLNSYAAVIRSHCQTYAPIKVAIDAGNSVGGIDTRAVFTHLHSVRIWEIAFEPDGYFPSRPPSLQNPGDLDSLCRCVIRHGCQFGVAFDGDSDALMAVDEAGQVILPDQLGGLIALILLQRHPGGIVIHQPNTTPRVIDAIQAAGGRTVATHENAKEAVQVSMVDEKALFGITNSGNYFYGDMHFTDNALRSLIELINGLAGQSQPLSVLTQSLNLDVP